MPEMDLPIQTPTRRPRPAPEAVPITIIYEDDSLIAVDKPPGVVVHPTYKNWSGTLLNGVLWHVRHHLASEPSIVTRLDKDTSGLVLVALNPGVHAQLQRDAASGLIRKQYLAAVCGTPDPVRGSISLPLARSPEDRRVVVVTPTGQECRTDYELVSTTDRCSLLRCELITGRTHQIRVHLAASGWPIVGDATYGAAHPAVARQALHAWRIAFPHPITRALTEIEAPVPPDLHSLMDWGV